MKDDKLSTRDLANATDRPDDRRPAHAVADATVDAPRTTDEPPAPLFAGEETAGYRARWSGIQTGFVDEPRQAVQEADALVAEVMKRLAGGFADERQRLEAAWERSETVSTEDLRQAMRRYRSFFERLLSV
jgi:enoyl-CoA hydratase/carnithine racemase